MGKRFNIAYLISHKTIGYPLGIQNGIRNAIEEQGHNLINIMDLLPSNSFLEWSHNYIHVAFELAAQMDFDAYIVPIGVANAFISRSKGGSAMKYVELLDPKKTFLLEEFHEGYRCITKDNKPGIRQLIRHLIEYHGYRKICFLSGPATSFGAKERETVYFEEMERHGIPVEDRMFARGLFSGACDEVVEELLSNNPDAEAIACASDHMAETVYRVMKKHGLTPGNDIAVTGFDDISVAAEMTPPLTTVRLSAYEMAYKAGYEVVRLCEGKPQETHCMESLFVHRLSCGETVKNNDSKLVQFMSQVPVDREAMAKQLLEDVAEAASKQVKQECYPRFKNFIDKIYNVLMDRDNRGSGHIVGQDDIVDIFRYDYSKFFSLKKFGDAVTDCYDYVASRLEGDQRTWILNEQAIFQRIIRKNIVEKYDQSIWEGQKRQHYITRITMDALMNSMDRKKAFKAMFENLINLGVKDAALLSFSEPIEYFHHNSLHMGDTLYLEVALSDGEIRVPENPESYKIFRLVENFMSQDMSKHALLQLDPSFTVGALLTGREMIGVLIVGPSIIDSTELVRVYHQMAVGMQHLELIHHEQELIEVLNRNNLRLSRESEHDMLTGVFNRRGFMNNLDQRINHAIMYDKSNSKAAIFYMDMDGLKQINDTYGHDEGDFAIRNSAEILTKAFGNGLVGRQGGDEFLGFCLLDGTVVVEPGDMIPRVDKLMEEFNAKSGKPYKLRISIGYMDFTIDIKTMTNMSSYMESADAMLYENKRKHKGLR